jgi:Arc/MetJ-type ribon-helix-helix transcriptional regulator
MIPEYEKRVAVRLPSKQRQQIDSLVEAGKNKNISEVIRSALKEFLSGKEKGGNKSASA